MTDPNTLLWNHAVDNEDWDEVARLQKIAEGVGNASVEATGNTPPLAQESPSSIPEEQ